MWFIIQLLYWPFNSLHYPGLLVFCLYLFIQIYLCQSWTVAWWNGMLLKTSPLICSLFPAVGRTRRFSPRLPLLIPPPCLVHPPVLSRNSTWVHLPPPPPPLLLHQLTVTWSPPTSARSPWPPCPSTTDRCTTRASSGSAWSSATMATCTGAYWWVWDRNSVFLGQPFSFNKW